MKILILGVKTVKTRKDLDKFDDLLHKEYRTHPMTLNLSDKIGSEEFESGLDEFKKRLIFS